MNLLLLLEGFVLGTCHPARHRWLQIKVQLYTYRNVSIIGIGFISKHPIRAEVNLIIWRYRNRKMLWEQHILCDHLTSCMIRVMTICFIVLQCLIMTMVLCLYQSNRWAGDIMLSVFFVCLCRGSVCAFMHTCTPGQRHSPTSLLSTFSLQGIGKCCGIWYHLLYT